MRIVQYYIFDSNVEVHSTCFDRYAPQIQKFFFFALAVFFRASYMIKVAPEKYEKLHSIMELHEIFYYFKRHNKKMESA